MSSFPAIFSYLRIFYVLVNIPGFFGFFIRSPIWIQRKARHFGAPDTSWDSLPLWPVATVGPQFPDPTLIAVALDLISILGFFFFWSLLTRRKRLLASLFMFCGSSQRLSFIYWQDLEL